MRFNGSRRIALAVSAVAVLGSSSVASAHEWHSHQPAHHPHTHPGCPAHDRAFNYDRTVMHADPSAYWDFGGPNGPTDLMGNPAADAIPGTQITHDEPGAITCSADPSVKLFGATPDGIWQSHIVAGPGAKTAAPGTAHFGIEIWVKPDTLDGNSRRIASREQADGGYLLAARSDALVFSRYAMDDQGTSHSNTVSAAPLPLHQWSYVVANYDTDGTMRLYVNGMLVAQQASDLSLPADPADGTIDGGRLMFGASDRLWSATDPNSTAYLEWDGNLDQAAFYGPDAHNLTPHEITKHWRVGNWMSHLGDR